MIVKTLRLRRFRLRFPSPFVSSDGNNGQECRSFFFSFFFYAKYRSPTSGECEFANAEVRASDVLNLTLENTLFPCFWRDTLFEGLHVFLLFSTVIKSYFKFFCINNTYTEKKN